MNVLDVIGKCALLCSPFFGWWLGGFLARCKFKRYSKRSAQKNFERFAPHLQCMAKLEFDKNLSSECGSSYECSVFRMKYNYETVTQDNVSALKNWLGDEFQLQSHFDYRYEYIDMLIIIRDPHTARLLQSYANLTS